MPKTPRLVANITTLTWDAPLLVRPSLARDFGFDAVECLFPYDHSLAAWDRALTASGSEMVLVNTAENQWEQGARGCAAIPGATARFMTQFAIARTYARHLGVGCIHVMAGRTTDPAAFDTFVKNLRLAADWTPDRRLTIEPLNPGDMPGYFLGDFALAARILDAVDRSTRAASTATRGRSGRNTATAPSMCRSPGWKNAAPRTWRAPKRRPCCATSCKAATAAPSVPNSRHGRTIHRIGSKGCRMRSRNTATS